ncbi:MAG: rhodanese-related sulfurtransferase [Candidatus Magasanikbacteria bacterium]
MYQVLLYYKYVDIDNPQKIASTHEEVCKALRLKGRVLISENGINGTLGGEKESIEKYKNYTKQHELLSGIDFKESESEELPFPDLSVKHRDELVTTDAKEQYNICNRAQHIKPKTLHLWMQQEQDNLVLLDMRNDYEWRIGRFKGVVRPPMKYFRDLPENLGFYEQFKGKKIVLFCTGGIRCEPASAMLINNGFDPDNLYQLEGGIMKYVDKYGDEGFYIGDCFVFDDRVSIEVDDSIPSECDICNEPCKKYRNCMNKHCNKLFIGCNGCMKELNNACSQECKDFIQNPDNKRPEASNHFRPKHRNKGTVCSKS